MSMLSELRKLKEGEPLHQKMRIAGRLVGNERRIEVRNPYSGALVGAVQSSAESGRAQSRAVDRDE